MKKAKEHADELITAYSEAIKNEKPELFIRQLTNVLNAVAVLEIKELIKARNVKYDSGLIAIYKDQRKKYRSISQIVNTVKSDLLSITDFDKGIKKLYPSMYDWYVNNILTAKH